MSISPEFMNFVGNEELIQIRSYLANYMIVDQSFETYEEAFKYASERVSILQEHDGSILEQDCEKWNKEYLNEQLVAVVSNFSAERLEHIKNVINVVLDSPAKDKSVAIRSIDQDKKTSRTGRTVVEERELSVKQPAKQQVTAKKPVVQKPISQKPISTTHLKERSDGNTSTNRTGRRTISEVEKKSDSVVENSSESSKDYGTAMIVGGTVVTTIGIVTVKPVVIGTGVAIISN